jgi:hypothetical protein
VFVREGSIVKLEANYVPAKAEVPQVDLSVAAEHFLARVVPDLVRDYPALGENGFKTRVSRELAVSCNAREVGVGRPFPRLDFQDDHSPT